MPKSLFKEGGQSLIIVAVAPGSIYASNTYRGIADLLESEGDSLSYVNHSLFDVRTVKKGYFDVFIYHFSCSLLPTNETPFRWESFAHNNTSRAVYPTWTNPGMRIPLGVACKFVMSDSSAKTTYRAIHAYYEKLFIK